MLGEPAVGFSPKAAGASPQPDEVGRGRTAHARAARDEASPSGRSARHADERLRGRQRAARAAARLLPGNDRLRRPNRDAKQRRPARCSLLLRASGSRYPWLMQDVSASEVELASNLARNARHRALRLAHERSLALLQPLLRPVCAWLRCARRFLRALVAMEAELALGRAGSGDNARRCAAARVALGARLRACANSSCCRPNRRD